MTNELELPVGLHPDTAELVVDFAQALLEKLYAAQQKYGYSDNWRRKGWADECRAELMRHIAKGDPRDVAAYCAFLWYHGQSTTIEQASQRQEQIGKVVRIPTKDGFIFATIVDAVPDGHGPDGFEYLAMETHRTVSRADFIASHLTEAEKAQGFDGK